MAEQGKSIVDLEKEIDLLKDKNKILKEAQGATNANNAKIKENLKQIETIEKRILKLKTDTREETEGQVDATEKLKNLSNDLTKLAAKEARLAKGKKGLLLEMRNIDVKNSQIRDAVRKGENAAGKKYNNDERNALKELEKLRLDSIENVMQDTFDLDAFKVSIDEVMEGIEDENIKDLAEGLKDAGENFDANSEGLNRLLNIDLPLLDQIDKFRDMAGDLKALIVNTRVGLIALAGLAMKEIFEFAKKAKEIRQDLGVSATESATMATQMRFAQLRALLLLGDTQKAADSIKAFADTTSNVGILTGQAADNLARVASLSGASAETTAELVKLNALAGKTSFERSAAELDSLVSLSKQKGVLSSKVFEDVASSAKDSSIFFGKTADEIARAAVEMRALGVGVDAIAKVSDAVLDLETSISKEFEMQALFGKSINFNRLRQLAFARDEVGLQKALVQELGGFADLSKLNAAQVQSIQQSLGLSNEDMLALVNNTGQFAKEGKEANSMFEGLKLKIIGLGALLGGLLGLLVAAKPAITTAATRGLTSAIDKKGIVAGMKQLALGGALGSAAGATIGAVAGAATRVENFEAVTKKGVLDDQIPGKFVMPAFGDNVFLSGDKRAQDEIDMRADVYTKEQRKNTDAVVDSKVEIVGAVKQLGQQMQSLRQAVNNITRK